MNIFKIDKQRILSKDHFSICYGCVNNNDLQIRVLNKQNINRGLINKLLEMQNINLSKIYAILEENEQEITIIEDYFEHNLHEEFKRRKKENNWFTEQEIAQIMTQIVKAYKYLYDHKIMHGNLSSMNVFLYGNQVKLGEISLHYLDGVSILCSPAFSAPEIFQTQSSSCLSEVFSLGILYYKLVTQTMPFKGNNIEEIKNLLQQLNYKPLKCPPQVSDLIAKTIESMLTYSIKDRMQWDEIFKNPLFNVKQPSIQMINSSTRSILVDSIFLEKNKFLLFNEKLFQEKGVEPSKINRFQHLLNFFLAKAQYLSYVQVELLSKENSLSVAKQAVVNFCISGMQLTLLKQCQGICIGQLEYLSQEFLKYDQLNLLSSLKEFNSQQQNSEKQEIFNLYMNAQKIFSQSQFNLTNLTPDSSFELINKDNNQFEDYIEYLEYAKVKLLKQNNHKLVKMYEKMLKLNIQYPLRMYSYADPKNILSISN